MTTAKHRVIEWFGWYGVGAIITAYALVSFEILSSTSLLYQLFNATGSIAILLDAWVDRNYQPVVLNVIWLGIALIALGNIFL